MRYDAVIVGASFAGLAVASRLKGNILLIDRKEIGTEQSSACGSLLSVPQTLDCMDSVLQVYHEGFIHTLYGTIQYDLPYPLCAFNYARFCQGLAERNEADFMKAQVLSLKDGRVVTDRGEFEATCLIDASGYRATLAGSMDRDMADPSTLSFGLEVITAVRGTGLYFWVDPCLVNRGVGWLFPCGEYSRAGIASYQGSAGVKEGLDTFLRRLGAESNSIHGGFLPWRLRKPVVGNIFAVGDAAGHCLPLTGEGIRPAIYFGMRCGDVVQQVIDGQTSLDEGLRLYQAEVLKYRRCYSLLEALQRGLSRLPTPCLTRVMALFRFRPVFHSLMGQYDYLFSLRRVNTNLGGGSHTKRKEVILMASTNKPDTKKGKEEKPVRKGGCC